MIPLAVIYRASSAEYAAGYEQLKAEFSGKFQIEWVEETDFKKNLVEQLSEDERGKGGIFGWILGAKVRPRYDAVLFLVDRIFAPCGKKHPLLLFEPMQSGVSLFCCC